MDRQISTSWFREHGGPEGDLDCETPEGLFGCSDGGLVLVASTDFRKVAIVLTAKDRPKFLVQNVEDDWPVDVGFSLGRARLRLTDKRGPITEDELDQTGLVRTEDSEVSISCQLDDGTLKWVRFGTVSAAQSPGLVPQVFDGWKLEHPATGRILYERKREDDCTPTIWGLDRGPASSISELQVDTSM
jgi:hypothetical protein